MSIIDHFPDTIKIESDVQQLFNNLIEGNYPGLRSHKNYFSDYFMICLGLGRYYGERKKLKEAKGSIPKSRFSGVNLMDGLAILEVAVHFENKNILTDIRQCVKVAEEVANAGAVKLEEIIRSTEGVNNSINQVFEEIKKTTKIRA